MKSNIQWTVISEAVIRWSRRSVETNSDLQTEDFMKRGGLDHRSLGESGTN